jgi:hypothetical protein
MTALSTRIYRDWERHPRIAQACISICEYLEHADLQLIEELSFYEIRKIASAQSPVADEEVALAVQYLTGAGIGVLGIRCYFIDWEGEYLLPNDEYLDAIKTGSIAHPRTGEEIRNVNSFVFPWYVPGRIFQKNI